MGTDMKLYVECRDTDGVWVLHGREKLNRSYTLYSALADVRREITEERGEHAPLIHEPKGLPDDVTAQVGYWFDQHRDDNYAASYFTLAELDAYDWEASAASRSDFYQELLPRLRQLGGGDNVRVVFWFDC